MRFSSGFLFYRLARFFVYCFVKAFFRLRVEGLQHIPAQGAFILATNHVSFLDPPVLAAAVPHRILRFIARDTLFKKGLGGWIMRNLRCIPLDRTKGDIAALRAVFNVLSEDGAVGLFPEGTRSPDGRLKKAKPGVGFLVAKAGVPLVPAFVEGTFQALPKQARWFRRSRIRVTFGSPMAREEFAMPRRDRAAYEKIGEIIMSRIAALETTRPPT